MNEGAFKYSIRTYLAKNEGNPESIGDRLVRTLDALSASDPSVFANWHVIDLPAKSSELLAIARCLCGMPRLVLLDEPTEGIQPSIIDEIVEILQRLRERSGLTMILVEQNLDFIAALSQRILIIQKGTITQEVRPGDLGDASLVGEFIGITA